MRTGRLSISRGHQQAGKGETPPPHLALVAPAIEPDPVAVPQPGGAAPLDSLQAARERLSALERLVRLYEVGALSIEEFTAEKLLILGEPPRPAPVHFVSARPRRRQGRSLLGRMLSWQFLLLCLAAGIGLSFATQPEATNRFVTQLYHSIVG